MNLSDGYFNYFGNSISAWLDKVFGLIVASRLIDNHVKQIRKTLFQANKFNPISFHAIDPCFMLKGFAIECYFKAFWLIRGNKFIVNNKFKPIPNSNEHDLRQLSSAVKLNIFTNGELLFMDALSHYSTGPGRYPVGKHSTGNKRFSIPDKYSEVFNEIIRKISNEILRYPKLKRKYQSGLKDIIKLVS